MTRLPQLFTLAPKAAGSPEWGWIMKKTYQKPTLVRRELLNQVAGVPAKILSGFRDDN
jgi:hypothetical protein